MTYYRDHFISNRVLTSRQNGLSKNSTISCRQQNKAGGSKSIDQNMETGANRDMRPMTAVSSAGFNSKTLGKERSWRKEFVKLSLSLHYLLLVPTIAFQILF